MITGTMHDFRTMNKTMSGHNDAPSPVRIDLGKFHLAMTDSLGIETRCQHRADVAYCTIARCFIPG
jgi:hypothetical protein